MKNLLLLCICLFSFGAFAQSTTQLKVSESEAYKDKVKSYDVLSLHTSPKGKTVLVRSGRKSLLFDIFDSNLNKIFSKSVKNSMKEDHVGDLFYNNQLRFFTVYAPKRDERIIYIHTLNAETQSYDKQVLFETTVEKKQSLFGSSNKHNTRFSISPDGKYFVIATDDIRKNKNAYTVRVFDTQTQKLQFKKSYQEDIEKKFVHQDLYISNAQTVYILGKQQINGRANKKSDGDANYLYVLNKISPDENTSVEINIGDDFIQSLNITKLKNQLHLVGFYSEKNIGKLKGGCDIHVDANTLEVLNINLHPLPQQVYADLYGKERGKRKKKNAQELKHFYTDYVLSDSQGATYLIAEEFYVTQHYQPNAVAGGMWQTTYHFDDVLIFKFDPDGSLAWARSIFKRADAPSYNAFIKNDQLHVILNSGKNLTEKQDGRTKVSQGIFESSALYDITYTPEGEVSYNKIQDNRGNTYYQPFYGTYETDKFIMMSQGGRKKRFMILE